MVVRLVAQDGEGAVELLDKDEAHQLVGKGHFAQRDLLVGAVIDLLGESVWAAHDEHQALAAAGHAALQPLAEVHRRALGAVFVEQDDVVAALEGGEQGAAFGNLLLGLAHVAGALHVADVADVELHIMLQALDIFVDALTNVAYFGLADDGERNLHFLVVV